MERVRTRSHLAFHHPYVLPTIWLPWILFRFSKSGKLLKCNPYLIRAQPLCA